MRDAERERDKARIELEMWRDGNILHEIHRDELEKVERERDEAREAAKLAASHLSEQTFDLRQQLGEVRQKRDDAREALQKVASLAYGNADKTICLINLNAIRRVIESHKRAEAVLAKEALQ